jgi:hypothetical protein
MQEEEKKIKDELRIRPFPVLQEVEFPRIEEKKPKECLEDIISRTFDEVKQSICEDYCRYTSGKSKEEVDCFWDSEICNNCPLNRL